jgi:hypothetical protein
VGGGGGSQPNTNIAQKFFARSARTSSSSVRATSNDVPTLWSARCMVQTAGHALAITSHTGTRGLLVHGEERPKPGAQTESRNHLLFDNAPPLFHERSAPALLERRHVGTRPGEINSRRSPPSAQRLHRQRQRHCVQLAHNSLSLSLSMKVVSEAKYERNFNAPSTGTDRLCCMRAATTRCIRRTPN